MDGVTRLSVSLLEEFFSDILPSILKAKKKELKVLELERCSLIDKALKHPDLPVYLTVFDSYSGYEQLKKEIKRMTRYMGIGGKRNRREMGMTVLPLVQIKLIPILDAFDFKKVKKSGRRTMVSCVLHEDKTPSAIINENNTYKCFSCGFSGDVIALTEKLYGFDFITAVKRLQGLIK